MIDLEYSTTQPKEFYYPCRSIAANAELIQRLRGMKVFSCGHLSDENLICASERNRTIDEVIEMLHAKSTQRGA